MERQSTWIAVFHKIVTGLFSLILLLVLFFLLFRAGRMGYAGKRTFLLGNLTLLLPVGAIFLLFGLCSARWRLLRQGMERYSDRAIRLLTKILFFFQVYVCYNAYFYTGWDVHVILSESAQLNLTGTFGASEYLSQYPNNLLLVYLFSLIRKIDARFGILDAQEGIMCILCIQCLLSALTGYLLFRIVRSFSGYFQAWFAWLCYLVLVGSSGWLMIPYSDSMGLFLPTLILFLYLSLQDRKHVRLKWTAIGALSCLGYHIKPQVSIVFIAILICEFFHFAGNSSAKASLVKDDRYLFKRMFSFSWRKTPKAPGRSGVLYALVGILLFTLLYQAIMKDLTSQMDLNKRFGPAHFIMMGLNSGNNGGYSSEDVAFSASFPDTSRRTAANLEVIRSRLQDMGPSGLGSHLARKLMMNYGDGTFAWRQEGTFFSYLYPPRNTGSSPALRNIIWGDGLANALNETAKQGVWVWILASSLGMAAYRKSADKTLSAVLLSIIGLTLFTLLFEARARYLYLYVPFYIIAGILGAGKILEALHRLLQAVRAKKPRREESRP